MKQRVSFCKFLSASLLTLLCAAACTSGGKTQDVTVDEAQLDSALEADAVLKVDELSPEQQQQMADEKAFLEHFYQQLDEDEDMETVVRQNVSANCLDWLKAMYDYDCESGDCIAFWLLTYNMTDPGSLKERVIEPVAEHTFKVLMTYDCGNGELYDYWLQLEVVKDGDAYKVNDVEELKNESYTNP
jgi:hypothetical protein